MHKTHITRQIYTSQRTLEINRRRIEDGVIKRFFCCSAEEVCHKKTNVYIYKGKVDCFHFA